MARVRKAEIAIFNFAFIDILATTIGVIMFIMVVAILNSSARISTVELKRQSDRAQDDLLVALPEANLATRDLVGARVMHEVARERLEKAQHEVSGIAGELDGLLRNLASLSGESPDLIERKSGYQATLGELEEQVAALELAVANRKPKREKVDFRLPVERETKKKQIIFECDDGKVFYMACEGTLDEGNYSAVGLGGAVLIQRREAARGETLAAAEKAGSLFRRAFTGRPRDDFYVLFLVRADSFALYRDLRSRLWTGGYELNWEVFDADGKTFFIGGGGGGGGTVQ